jgi:hypothetical protein
MPHRHKTIKIVSGGQTGADRAALDFAREHGFSHGGWCPLGRLAEDGALDASYRLKETPSSAYAQRTEWNVRDSDGTVIFTLTQELAGGSLFTQLCARQLGKPFLHLARRSHAAPHARLLREFLQQHQIRILNVAGPRASFTPGIAEFVQEVLASTLLPLKK